MLIVVTASGLPLSREVVSQEYGHIGSSTIHTSPGLMTIGRSHVMPVAVFATIFRGGVPRETPLITRTKLPTSAPGVIPAGYAMFWHPESVMEVGLEEFEASALNRRTKQSPACTMPLGSGV